MDLAELCNAGADVQYDKDTEVVSTLKSMDSSSGKCQVGEGQG
jgi:hypothetical protein